MPDDYGIRVLRLGSGVWEIRECGEFPVHDETDADGDYIPFAWVTPRGGEFIVDTFVNRDVCISVDCASLAHAIMTACELRGLCESA